SRPALIGVVTGGAFIEHLLARRGIGLREIDLDWLLGRRGALAFLLHSGNGVAHLFRPLAVEILAGDDQGAERDNAREQHPAGDGVEAIVHEFSLVFAEGETMDLRRPLRGSASFIKTTTSAPEACARSPQGVEPEMEHRALLRARRR